MTSKPETSMSCLLSSATQPGGKIDSYPFLFDKTCCKEGRGVGSFGEGILLKVSVKPCNPALRAGEYGCLPKALPNSAWRLCGLGFPQWLGHVGVNPLSLLLEIGPPLLLLEGGYFLRWAVCSKCWSLHPAIWPEVGGNAEIVFIPWLRVPWWVLDVLGEFDFRLPWFASCRFGGDVEVWVVGPTPGKNLDVMFSFDQGEWWISVKAMFDKFVRNKNNAYDQIYEVLCKYYVGMALTPEYWTKVNSQVGLCLIRGARTKWLKGWCFVPVDWASSLAGVPNTLGNNLVWRLG